MSKTASRPKSALAPSAIRPAAAAILCLTLLNPGLPALSQSAQSLPAKPAPTKLDPDQRILHVLSRFTFGPTPQDIAAVRKSGIDAWFEQQLHPDRLPDSQLNVRLADFPALNLPVETLMERFPSGAEIRQAANGKRDIPRDPTLKAIYTRHIALYEEKQAKKAEADKKPTEVAMSSQSPDPAKPAPNKSSRKVLMSDGTMAEAPGTSAAQPDIVSEPSLPGSLPRKNPLKRTATQEAATTRPAYADLLVNTILALPPQKRVARLLSMQPAEYEQLRSSLKGPQKLQLTQDLTPAQRELVEDYDNPTRTVIQELQGQRLLRDIYSTHQLQEVMTTFWLNHFNVYLHKNEETPYYLVSYERNVIRPHALGNFEDLLVATAESPAMLLYLDNSTSTGPDSPASEKQKQRAALGKPSKATPPGLNENYARELMELHTLGVNGGYTQKDVTEVAKVFTGWTVETPAQGGHFKFDETRHEPGKKLVMGKKFKEDGQKEGLQLLHMLATSPATAHFISQELAIAFVSDNPPPALVNRMAQTFLGKHGDIASVLKTMLHSPEFWAPAAYQAKVKTPLEYVVSAARASDADITNTQPLVNALNQMGMPLYGCVPPTGYSDKADEWVSTGALVTRMNFALSLSNNKLGGIKSDWTYPESIATSSDAVTINQSEQILEARLIPTGISDQTREAVLTQSQTPAPNSPAKPVTVPAAAKPIDPAAQIAAQSVSQSAAQSAALERQNAQLAGLLLGSPEFQRR